MAKIELNSVTSGYNLAAINDNFQKIEDELKNKVVYRDEVGPMAQPLDMNNQKIINNPDGTADGDLVTMRQFNSLPVVAIDDAVDTAVAAAASAEASAIAAAASAGALSPTPYGTSLVQSANASAARTLLGATGTGTSLFTATDAAAARTAVGATAVGNSLITAADAAAARTAIGAADSSSIVTSARTISAGGLATGGGSLAADRTITVTAASQAQAEAGADATTAMTPQRTEQHMLANALGWGQTWQNVAGSRVANTSYQNTTGRPIQVSVKLTGDPSSFQVSSNNSTWITLTASTDTSPVSFAIIPNNWYYRANGPSITINVWAELR